MDIVETVKNTSILQNYRHIVLGLSGGPDSMCLFDVLRRLSEAPGMPTQSPAGAGSTGVPPAPACSLYIWPVHVNHMLRPVAADRDQAYVEALCRENGLPLKVVKFDCTAMAKEQGLTSEEAGRVVRYDAFREMARDVQAKIQAGEAAPGKIAIALAHHADDQAETILYRIIRGTGTDGLVGMEPVRQDESGFDIVRPLLGVRRADIEAYCRQRGLDPCIDHTNNEPMYARNRIRLDLIPLMERYNPRVVESVDRLGAIAAEDKAFLDAQAREAAARHKAVGPGSADPNAAGTQTAARCTPQPAADSPAASRKIAFRLSLLEEHPAISRRVLAAALADLGLTEDVTYAHFHAMMALGNSASPSARVDLPHGYIARREYDLIVLAASGGNPTLAKAGSRSGAASNRAADEASGSGAAVNRAADEASGSGAAVNHAGIQVLVMSAAEYQEFCEGALRSAESSGAVAHQTAAPGPGGFAAFDYDVLAARYGAAPEEKILLRTRRPGDLLPIRSGRKKLQDVFVDEKVPRFERDEVHLAAIGSEVLWIPAQEGLMRRARYAAGCGVTDRTGTVLWLGLRPDCLLPERKN